jgi:beta-lactamase regulating signal transducer with metallopeptidase domain
MMAILNALMEITAYSFALYGFIWLFRRLFRGKLSARLTYALWFLLVLRLLMPVTLASPVHLLSVPLKEAAPVQVQSAGTDITGYGAPASGNDEATAPALAADDAAVHPEVAPAVKAAPPTPVRIGWPGSLLGVWLAGMAGMLLYFLLLSLRMRRRIRKECMAAPESLNGLLDGLCRSMGLRGRPEMLMAKSGGSPCLTASLRPKLLLPASMPKCFSCRQLAFAIEHELTHYRRRDHIVGLLLNILRCVYWFNPIVWLAAKQMQADMETACDSDIVGKMRDEDRKYYAQTLLALFNRGGMQDLALGMAEGNARAAADRRIRGVFSKRRSGRGAKWAAATLALIMLFACFTTACRPTPKEPAVAGKDGDKLEKIIKSTQGAQGSAQTPTPSAYKDSFKGADENVTIDFDAEVTTPGCNLPVVEVRPHAFTMEQVRAAAAVLLQGEKAYEPQVGMTKAGLQMEIVELKKLIADDKALLDSCGGDRKTADKVKAQYVEQLAAYEKLLPSAPDAIAQRETDWAFHPEAYYMDPVESAADPSAQSGQAFRATGIVNGYHAFVQAGNSDTDDAMFHYLGFTLGKDLGDNGYYPKWRFADDKPMTMTRDEVVAFALDSLGRMGIGNMTLVSCKAEGKPQSSGASGDLSPSEALALAASAAPRTSEPAGGQAYSYYMTFVPTYGGVPLLETGQYISEKDAYGPPYFYEELRVRVRDGLITDFYWSAPLEEVRVENADVATLSFGQALEAFKAQMQRAYTLDHLASYTLEGTQNAGRAETGTITITDIQLGLMRVRVKDKPGTYRLVPAWMFSGTEQIKIKGMDAPVAGMRSRDGLYAYAVINAVDGSVIDPALGY